MQQNLPNLPTRGLENGLNLATANELLQMTEGLTLTKILAEESEADKLQERFDLLILMYRDAQRTVDRCLKEGKDLKLKIDALPPKVNLKNTDGAFMKVGKFIAEVVKQLNVNNSMNEKQIDFAATDILDQYGEKMTLKELAWIFRKGIMGNYGKTDFKLDVQTLHAWLPNILVRQKRTDFATQQPESTRSRSHIRKTRCYQTALQPIDHQGAFNLFILWGVAVGAFAFFFQNPSIFPIVIKIIIGK